MAQGSATEHALGAELACQTLLTECAAWLAQTPDASGAAVAETLIEQIQTALSSARGNRLAGREFPAPARRGAGRRSCAVPQIGTAHRDRNRDDYCRCSGHSW